MGTPQAPVKLLLSAAVQRDLFVAAAETGNEEADAFIQDQESGVVPVSWRHSSTLSARAAVSSARDAAFNQGGALSDVIIFVSPPAENRGFHQIPPGDLDSIIQSVFAGTLYILRESISALAAGEGGSCTIILDEGNQEVMPPPAAGMLYGIQRTVEGLFRTYANEKVAIQGIRFSGNDMEQFADFIYDEYFAKPDKAAYRWFKYSGRSGLFGRAK